MRKIFYFVFIALLFAGCKNDTFTMSGTLENGVGHTLWLEEIAPEGPLFIDSIPVDDKGAFSYKYKLDSRGIILLQSDSLFGGEWRKAAWKTVSN